LTDTSSPSDTARSDDQHPAFSRRLVAASAAAWAISLFGYYTQVQLLSPIMREFERGEAAVGWLFSLENTILAVCALVVAGPLARWSRVRVAMVGTTVVVLANAASAFAWSFEALTVMRAFAGAGAGIAGAAGIASAASTRDPDRLFAAVMLAWGLGGALGPAIVPFATADHGSMGGYLLIGAVCLGVMPLLGWLVPPHPAKEEAPSLFTAPNRSLAVIAMAGLLVYEIGQGGIWTFIEQIGIQSQLTEHQVGVTLTGTDLAGLGGAAIAAALGTRFGRMIPIVIGIVMNTTAAVVLATCDDSVKFVLMVWLWNFAYYFVVPYLLGAMAELDDLGRWVIAADAVWQLGDGFGPGIAGTIVERGGLADLADFGLATGLVCVVLMSVVIRRIDARRDTEGARPGET